LHKLVCRNIELVTIDAAGFEIPDDVTVAYLYHPFGGETFEAMIGKIIESLDRNPRRLTLIYQMPWREDYVLSTGRFELVRTVKRRRNDPRRIAVYESVPAREQLSVLSEASLSFGVVDRQAEQHDQEGQRQSAEADK
jgi:hypothetical protein